MGKLLDIAHAWTEFAKIPEKAIRDIILTGGNCNYNYTSASDLDVHIVVDYSEVNSDKDFLLDYYFSKKALWADKYPNMTVKGYPVELFAQDVTEKPHAGQGVYSLLHHQWIQSPVYMGLNLHDNLGVEVSAKELSARIDLIVDSDRGQVVAEDLLNQIYSLRSSSIAKDGEFGQGTLTFKELRNTGKLDKLKKYISDRQTNEFSLD